MAREKSFLRRRETGRVACSLSGAAIAVVCALFASGCLEPASSPVGLWAFHDQPTRIEFAPDSSLSLADINERPRIDLQGAIGETLGFLLLVRTFDEPVERPEIHAASLRSVDGLLSPSVVRIDRVQRVEIDQWPGWHLRAVPPAFRDARPLDVLVPLSAPRGGLPTVLLPGETYHFWVDVAIPKGISAGVYAGDVELRGNGRALRTLTIRLTVLPFVMPSADAIPFLVDLDHRVLFRHHLRGSGQPHEFSADGELDTPLRAELDALLLSTLQTLRAHRLTPLLPYLSPGIRVNASGGLDIDWRHYDAIAGPCLSGEAFFDRTPSPVWPLPLDRLVEPMLRRGSFLPPSSAKLLEAYVKECAAHFARKGWLSRCHAVLPAGSREVSASFSLTDQFAGIVHAASPDVPVVSRLFPQDMAPYGWTDFPRGGRESAIDIWMTKAQFFDPEVMAAERAAGKHAWLAVDRPPFSGITSVYARPGDVRALCWQARQLGTEALHAGCVNPWPAPIDGGVTPAQCLRAAAGTLLYPGRVFGLVEPVVSLRLKRIRRTMQDAALAHLLDRHGLEHVPSTLEAALVPYCGTQAYHTHYADGRQSSWPFSRTLFDEARGIMAAAFERQLSDPAEAASPTIFADDLQWRRFMLSTRRVDIAVDAVRLRHVPHAEDGPLRAECVLTLRNRKRVPVAGAIGFADLPEGWSASSVGRRVSPIPPNTSRRLTLSAGSGAIASDAAGVLTLPVLFETDDGAQYRVDARLSSVSALWADRPIVIDGDLSDWPVGVINVMSDFVLITGEPPESTRAASARPDAATTAFVLRDDRYLYVAVNCHDDGGRERDAVRRTLVRYDDLIPVGEELVEILIDPLGAGTRSPSDLYHIVVKRSGPYMTQRGIAVEPPCGAHRPWAAGLDLATTLRKGRWVLEMRIPLVAFEDANTQMAVWGLNITRFDLARQEYSSWSGAVGNAYDPLSLGNLHWPQ